MLPHKIIVVIIKENVVFNLRKDYLQSEQILYDLKYLFQLKIEMNEKCIHWMNMV